MRTLTALMEAQRLRNGARGIWLVVGTFDMYGLATEVIRYASEDYTLEGNDYAGLLAVGGLDIGAQKIAPSGGLSDVSSFSVRIRDEEGESLILDTHVLYNDPVVVYFLYHVYGAAEADLIELVRGVVDTPPRAGTLWTLSCKDGTKQDLKMIPQALVDPSVYTAAYSPGAVVPEAFGNLNAGPGDGTGAAISLAPCRFYSKVELTATSGIHKKTGTTPFQWYDAASRFAEIITYGESAGVLTAADPERKMLLRPSRAKATNDRTDWASAADDDLTTSVALATGQNLDLWLSGAPKLGSLTAIAVVIKAAGSYTLTIKDFTTVKAGPTGYTGDQTITLTLGDYSDSWNLELLNVEIDGPGGGSSTIKEVYLQISFLDFMSLADQEPKVFQKVVGWNDIVGNYMDGAVIDTNNTAPRNPAYLVAVLLRGRRLYELATAKVNQTLVDDAAALRADWHFDFALGEQVSDAFLHTFGFEAGLCIFPSAGEYNIIALDKDRTPQHFFHGGYHTIVKGQIDKPATWEHDLSSTPADATQIFNELNIRYAKHPATGVPQRSVVASGQYRLSGVCNTSSVTSKLTWVSGDNFADVAVGERIYVSGDITYQVDVVDSSTVLSISSTEGGGVVDNSNKDFYLGPNIDGICFASQQAYKTVNALGGNQQRTFLNDGGYISGLIYEDATAELWRDHLKEWFATPRDRIAFSVHHDGIVLQQGDIFFLDHPLLKPSQQSQALSSLLSSISSSATLVSLPTGAGAYFREDDWLWVQDSDRVAPECWQVTAVDLDADTITVNRHQLNTPPSAHAAGVIIYRLTTKWLCTSVTPVLPGYQPMKVEAEQMPAWYFPTGRVVYEGYAVWLDASLEERLVAGWGTLRNGRVIDTDPASAISYVGPSTGRYTIT